MARKSRYLASADCGKSPGIYTAGLYLRLSVEDGDNIEQNSIGNQKKICQDYIRRHEDIRLGQVYIDHGLTGMNFNRPGFQSLVQDLRAGKLNCILVKDVSRLGRHYIMTSEYVEQILPALDVRLICINDGYDSADPTSDRDSLLMPFKLIMNDSYVKDTARKINSSIQTRMGTGTYLPAAGSIPYGYLRCAEANTYTIDQEPAAVVERIFQMRADGLSFNGIARQLNTEQIPCPGRLKYLRGQARQNANALWLRQTVRRITEDPVYLGGRVHGKLKRERLGVEKKWQDRDTWRIIEKAHPAIITQALFDAVQQVNLAERERRKGQNQRTPPRTDYRSLFRGKVFCLDCGQRLCALKYLQRPESPLSDSVYFECSGYHSSNGQRCSSHYIRQEQLMQALMDSLASQIEVAADLERLASKVQGHPQAMRRQAELKRKLASIQQSRGVVAAKKERLLEHLLEGILDRQEYCTLKQQFTQEYALLCQQENQAQKQLNELHEAIQTARRWSLAIQRAGRLDGLDEEMMHLLVDQITVGKDRRVEICFTYQDPFSTLLDYLEGGYAG